MSDSEQYSRFRTRQGAWGSIKELFSSIPALKERILPKAAHSPWLPPSAIAFLDRELTNRDRMLELGGGSSTAWLASRVRTLLTIENDENWAAGIRCMISGHSNVKVVHATVAESLDALPFSPTVVLVDHKELPHEVDRASTVCWAISQPDVRAVVLDDSDRARYQWVLEALEDDRWERLTFRGFRPKPWRLTETTVLWRTSSSRKSDNGR